MSVQVRTDIDTRSPFLSGSFKEKGGTIFQDAGRTIPLVRMTVLGRIAATQKLVPLDTTATNGSQYPAGIYNGYDILAATIVAGDAPLAGSLVYGGDGKVDPAALVFENAETLDTVVTGETKTVRDFFNDAGIFFQEVEDSDGYENS